MRFKKNREPLHVNEIMAQAFIVLLIALTGIRGYEWIIKGINELKEVSPLYIQMQSVIDIQTLGWFLIISAICLTVSIFAEKNEYIYINFIIGGLIGSTTHLFFGMASVGSAGLFTTYYSALIMAFALLILALIGVLGLWKKKQENKQETKD